MSDLDLRIELMDEYGINMQVLSTPSPPVDELFEPRKAQELARLANDSMAELIDLYSGRFIGVATVSMVDVEAAADETVRAVKDLGMRGVLLYSSQQGKPIDRPELDDFYGLVEELDVPVWLHPERASSKPDYEGEDLSRYGIFLVFGWPYETTVAMARLVLSGVMERHPRLKIIGHHAGAMIPRMANRIRTHYNNLPRVDSPDLPRPAIEYFKRFYVDTITQGSPTALMAAYELFGADRMLFATDMPFGGEDGRNFIRLEIAALEGAPIPAAEKEGIWGPNLLRICGLDDPAA